MQPEDNRNAAPASKTSQAPLNRQINHYRNALPQMDRSQGHFFFKQVTRHMQEITYVTIGYRIGGIPFEMQDLLAVAVNHIHFYCDVNLKVLVDGDSLWVTGSIGMSNQEINSLDFRVQEAHLSESLRKTQRILAQFMEEVRSNPRREDKIVLEKLEKEIVKQIQQVFKNPDLQD